MKNIKVISLNVENHKHIDRVLPLLQKEKPDIILLQEVYQENLKFYESALNMKGFFAPHCIKQHLNMQENATDFWGTATFTAHPVNNFAKIYYDGSEQTVVDYDSSHPENQAKALLQVTIEVDNTEYTFLNTHFTWTPKGLPTPKQEADLVKLLATLETIPEFILMGDFNAPRGGVTFNQIAAKYKDNIPAHITTTLDKNYHRAGDLQYVVDGCFTTPEYKVTEINIVDGVSDHYAIIATISFHPLSSEILVP